MSYFSRYTLKVEPNNKFSEVRKYFEEYLNVKFASTGVGEMGWRWLNFKQDVREVSRAWPDTLLVVERVGDEDIDIERLYARNGVSKATVPEIVWPPPPKV